MKNVDWKKMIVKYITSYIISCVFLAKFCSVELSTSLWYSIVGGFVVPILWNLWLNKDPNDTTAEAYHNAYLYDTDVGMGKVIAEAERLSGNEGQDVAAWADFYADVYNTDRATGALIVAMENLGGEGSTAQAHANAAAHNTDLATGAIIAALENTNKAKSQDK